MNWVAENLDNAFRTWNEKMAELWALLQTSPQEFKGGTIWAIIVTINGAMQGIGYGLLVLFLAMSIFKGTVNIQDLKRPEQAIRYFLRFAAAKVAITYGMDIMVAIYNICAGIIARVADQLGGGTGAGVALPDEMRNTINSLGFLESIPLWLVTILGSLFILVLSFIMILTVYSRFFKLFMYSALAPLPLATFAGDGTSQVGKSFIKSYVGVCLEGAVIVLACLLFSAFTSSSPPGYDPSASAFSMVWTYVGETIFNLLILVGLVKGADRIVKEMMGL